MNVSLISSLYKNLNLQDINTSTLNTRCSTWNVFGPVHIRISWYRFSFHFFVTNHVWNIYFTYSGCLDSTESVMLGEPHWYHGNPFRGRRLKRITKVKHILLKTVFYFILRSFSNQFRLDCISRSGCKWGGSIIWIQYFRAWGDTKSKIFRATHVECWVWPNDTSRCTETDVGSVSM